MAEEQEKGEAVLEAIPLVVVAEDEKTPARAHRGYRIPKIIDYLVVAAFMYFTL